MSNLIDNEDNAKDLSNRVDDLSAMTPPAVPSSSSFKVKPPIPKLDPVTPPSSTKPKEAEELIRAVEMQQEAFRANAIDPKEAVKNGVAVLDNLKIRQPETKDFTDMSEDDVFNLDVPMEARPFSSEDSLKVDLVDKGMVARWVNKDARRLGSMIAKGFRYVTPKDLASRLEVEVTADAEGHFSLGDVILMMITKERYFPALRAAHLRAVNSVGSKGAHRRALSNANEFMNKEVGGGYKQEAEENKVAFYTPGVSI